MDRILSFLSAYGTSLTYEKLPAVVVHQAKRRIIDTLGCAMGCYHSEPPRIARAHALECIATPGATVLGTEHQTAPELAAFANGVMARYLDFNDTSISGKGGHPSDNITAVLAAAEYAGADMKAAILGIVMAYEVQDRFGAACRVIRNSGWDAAVYVGLGSAAGASVAMGLDKEQMAHALSLAAVSSAGMSQTRVGKLSMWKGCAGADGARNGVFAALMARRGMSGPEDAFEGPCGFKRQFNTPLELAEFGGADIPFCIEFDKFKYFPCDYEAQCSITPALELYKKLEKKTEHITKIDIETYDRAVEIAADGPDKWNPTTRETADHSIPYVVALALTQGAVSFDDFSEERIADPGIHSLMQKIKVRATAEGNKDWPDAYFFRITVTMTSGQSYSEVIRYAKGHPKNPMTDEEIAAKFRGLTEPLMGSARVNRILGRLWRLEDMTSVRELLGLFALNKSIEKVGTI